MIGAALFGGFFAGIAATVALLALLPRLARLTGSSAEAAVAEEPVLPENKELLRLRRQLAEIERYNGSSTGEIGGLL